MTNKKNDDAAMKHLTELRTGIQRLHDTTYAHNTEERQIAEALLQSIDLVSDFSVMHMMIDREESRAALKCLDPWRYADEATVDSLSQSQIYQFYASRVRNEKNEIAPVIHALLNELNGEVVEADRDEKHLRARTEGDAKMRERVKERKAMGIKGKIGMYATKIWGAVLQGTRDGFGLGGRHYR